ncbi:hypothetical protein TSUD_237330 [Trifolium subterraneum]|uniref:DYW domain-containing protein n=1 Tax=Trifolium subterraneum TaxID=3900 RepID=A0A2Z6PET1_TRISU|nr:hypothetical protein TSUD_237330 [Trifolium subterraneum]
MPNVTSVLHDVDEEEKGMVLRVHCEKLAVAFGIMNSVPGDSKRFHHFKDGLCSCGDYG